MNNRHALITAALASALAAVSCGSGGTTTSTGSGGSTGSQGTGGMTGSGGMTVAGSTTGTVSTTATGSGGSGGGMPTCDKADGWPTYGHDAARTFASNACIKGPFTTAFRYVPTPPANETIGQIFHATTAGGVAYLKWKGHMGPYFGTPFIDAVNADGGVKWQYNSTVDSSFGQWTTVAFGGAYVVNNDDGLTYLDATNGMGVHSAGVDFWGQMAPGDANTLYVVNSWKVDGPGVFVGAYDKEQKQLWAQNQISGGGQFNPVDSTGGMAVDGATLFFAPTYTGPDPAVITKKNGLYAFTAATGTPLWNVDTTPAGQISAGGGHVYLTESPGGMAQLVARKQSDGSIDWMVPMPMGVGAQSPVLAGGLVIVGTGAGVEAYQAATGKLAWTAAGVQALSFGLGSPPGSTLMAASLATNTLVVGGTDITLLDLGTGALILKAKVDKAMGSLSEPVLAGGRLWVVDGSGLLALDSAP